MFQTMLQVEKGAYPFGEEAGGEAVRVEDVQLFPTPRQLQEKRSEMSVKAKLLDSPYIVRLLKIYQEDLTLHYIYEYVPFGFSQYVRTRVKVSQSRDNSNRLFAKKIASELMLLISYLVRLKIEVDLSVENLGFTAEEKLKVFMSHRCKMGHKTELSLVAHYNASKDKLLDFIDQQINLPNEKQDEPNFVIKGNRLVFPSTVLNESIYDSEQSFHPEQINYKTVPNSYESGIFSSHIYEQPSEHKNPTASCIGQSNADRLAFLRHTQSPIFGRTSNFSECKFSTRSSRKPKHHKNSFQFGTPPPPRGERMGKRTEDHDDAKSFTHSRSIRIEFQQKQEPGAKKQRKDSYKVKVTSFHEYEMEDCDPKDLFGGSPEGGDLFDFLNKQTQNHRKKNRQHTQQPRSSDFYTQPEPVFMKKANQEEGCPSVSSARNLQEKVRLAKEKASNLLSRYMKTKKMSSVGH